MSRFMNILLVLLQSVTAAYGGYLIYRCVSAWDHGESPNPLCVMGWHGYVEVHHLDERDRISCDYRPDITDAPR